MLNCDLQPSLIVTYKLRRINVINLLPLSRMASKSIPIEKKKHVWRSELSAFVAETLLSQFRSLIFIFSTDLGQSGMHNFKFNLSLLRPTSMSVTPFIPNPGHHVFISCQHSRPCYCRLPSWAVGPFYYVWETTEPQGHQQLSFPLPIASLFG